MSYGGYGQMPGYGGYQPGGYGQPGMMQPGMPGMMPGQPGQPGMPPMNPQDLRPQLNFRTVVRCFMEIAAIIQGFSLILMMGNGASAETSGCRFVLQFWRQLTLTGL